ncbi:FAD-dependent monooxygenase [Kibdelosporangium lantanae]
MPDQVIIVGAGPTGLALAAELALNGVACRVLERRTDVPNITRAFGVNARTLEYLHSRGMAEEVISRGNKSSEAVLAMGATIDFRPLPTPFNYMVIVPQSGTETVLEKRCHDLGVPIERGAELVRVRQDDDGVDVTVRGDGVDTVVRASYVVGCDGAHSRVRDEIHTRFVGDVYDVHLMLADVRLSDPPAEAVYTGISPAGIQLLVPFGDGYHRSISFRHGAAADRPLTIDEVRAAAVDITGSDFGMHDPRWMTRFLSERRQAEHYRVGRVFLAGDAAHVHSPAGAQGMNTGIGDAMNLGWKLAAAVHGTAPEWLLDTYETERHPVGEQVLKVTDRVFRLIMNRSPVAHRMLGALLPQVFKLEAAQRFPRTFLSGIGIAYAPRGRHPHKLAGHRMPGVTDLAEDMRRGRFLLVTPAKIDDDRVDQVVRPNDPAYVLVRPDGYVAWAGTGPAEARTAITEWCGR